jgi:fatty-acyl-CoA synthase
VVVRDALLHRAEADPGLLAYSFQDAQLTYAELAERATARASALQARGIASGDRIALAMSVAIPFVEVYWALQLIGAVPCVFNPFVPSQTLARRIAQIRPQLVLTDEVVHETGSAGSEPIEPDIGPEDLAFLQLTSGTSGAPRASMLLHRNVMSYLRASGGRVVPGDVFVDWVPPWHDLGLVLFIIGPAYYGVTCHIVEPGVSTIPEWLATISRVRGTLSGAPDFAFRLAARMVDPTAVDVTSLRFVTSGGEPVRWSSIEAFEERFGVPGTVMPGYGLGEATLGVTTHIPGEPRPLDERGNVSCGKPRYELEVRAGDSIDNPADIIVRGDGVFAGYFDAPEETNRVLRDGWLHTGDTGYFDADGNLYVLGRREGMIKRAGGLVAPRELEEAAQRCDGVRLAAAISVPATSGNGDVIVVAVEADADDQRSADRIAGEVSREIVAALGFAPGRVSVLPRRTIPRTENGKIRHGELRALLSESGDLRRAAKELNDRGR